VKYASKKYLVGFSLPTPSKEEKALPIRNPEGKDKFQHLLWIFRERTC